MLAWECMDMLYEWTGAAGVSLPHLGVNERVQPGYLPITYVEYEMVQLGNLPLTLIWMNWCSWGISPSPRCSASQMAEAVGSASIGHRSDTFVSDRCLVGVGPGVFAMWYQDARMYFCIFMVYVYVMQYLVCMKLNTRPHKFIHPYISHTSQIPIIHHLCPCQPRLFKKTNYLPPYQGIVCFIYGTSFKKFIMYTWCIHAACFVHWYPYILRFVTKFLLIWVEEVVKDCWWQEFTL